MASIKCGHCTKTHTSVEMVRTCAFSSQADSKAAPLPVTEPGMYQKPNGIVYRVKWNKDKTFLYAQRVDITQHFGKKIVYTFMAGAMKELTADMRMTLEQAEAFGIEHHHCCVCGRELFKKTSQEAGIGPICASKI
jgi:uncharacterized protein DUF6011